MPLIGLEAKKRKECQNESHKHTAGYSVSDGRKQVLNLGLSPGLCPGTSFYTLISLSDDVAIQIRSN